MERIDSGGWFDVDDNVELSCLVVGWYISLRL